MRNAKLWLVMTIAGLLCCMTVGAQSFEIEGIQYNAVSSWKVEVTSNYRTEYSGAIVIPSSVTYNSKTYHVTAIGSVAFNDCEELASITIPASVTSIGDYAFNGCSGLKEVILEDGSTTLSLGSSSYNQGLFYDCPLERVYMGRDLDYESWEYSPFQDKTKLSSLTIGEMVTTIGDCCFRGCSSLTSIAIPDGVTTIENNAFRDCSSLTSLTIGKGLTQWGGWVLYGCNNLTDVTIDCVNCPSSNSLSSSMGESSISKLVLGENVENIAPAFFANLQNLTSIKVSENNSIYDSRQNCNAIIRTSTNRLVAGCSATIIPESVTTIGCSAFEGCSKLTSIDLPNNLAAIESFAFKNCTGLTSITIPQNLRVLGSYVFEGCSGLTSINIPNTIISTGDNLFRNCTGITSISLPGSIKKIGLRTFEGCINLATVTIEDGMESIGEYAFSGCSGITSISIPKSMKEIDNDSFYGCENLAEVHINSLEAWCNIDFESNPLSYAKNLYLNGELVTELMIPEGMEHIGYRTFEGCTSITSIIIPNSMTSIGGFAFYDCTNLRQVINLSDLNILQNKDNGYLGYYADWIINVDEIIDGYGFKTIDNTHYLVCYIGDDTDLVLPQDYNGESYQIGNGAFEDRTHITSIAIPNNITGIGRDAFRGCSSLTSITIPESVTSIGGNAFYYCDGLTQVTLNCANIDGWFSGNSSIKEIILGENVTSIGNAAFEGCSGLTSVTIPENVTSIGEKAFRHCEGITSITIPSSVTSIGNQAFAGCVELKEIIFEDGAETLSLAHNSDEASIGPFYECPLEYVYLGRNLNINWGYNYFSPFQDANTIEIGNGVTTIADYTFRGCYNLTSITISEGITEIGYDAFEDCNELTQVTFDCANIGSWFSGKSSIKEVILGENVKTIGDYAFSGCSGITSINIPEGVTSMGYGAFNECESLAAVHINNLEAWYKITFGGDGWHDYNSNPLSYAHNLYLNGDLVTELVIPEGVTSIRSQAFSGCTNITSVSIPESVTSIENEAFNGCENLAEVHINSLEAWCNIDFGSNPLSYAKNLYLNGELVTDLVIPSTITAIKRNTFNNCQNLTSVVIPEGVTSIEGSAFSGCSGITSINIPKTVTSIENSAFSGCSSLTSITIPEGVTSLSYYTFAGCSSLTSIILPESITSLSGEVFEDCSNLTTVTILGSLTQVEDGNPFSGCSNLKEMILGEKVRKIEAGAFSRIESIEKVIVHATQPPRTDGDIFSDEVYDNATLYVPQGCISKYQVMTGWSGFYNISEMEGGTPDYLTIRQADNGAVKIAVDLGRTYKVQIEPSEGWAIHSVTINGEDMTDQLDENYTFTTPTLTASTVLNVAYEQIASKVKSAQYNNIKVRGYESTIFVDGIEQGDCITIYTASGTAVAEIEAESSNAEIAVDEGVLYIVKVSDKVIKIQM